MPQEAFFTAAADASPGGSTSRAKAPCAPYGCAEILAFLDAHPEASSPLLLAYVARQQRAQESVTG